MLPLLFDWDAGNVDHVARHGIAPEEVEDALLDPQRIGADVCRPLGEARWAYLGSTDAGRVLFVVTTRRRRRVRVVTAREA
ncbi:MAG TPA: BrnT family toxin, partial [Candidatus Dormibacteraeota bacterium]